MNYLSYCFFDYKYNILNFESDLFSIEHIIFIIMSFISVILLVIFSNRIKKETINKFIKVMAVTILCLEIIKITWESYYDITTGRGFNKEGILPIYTCSLYIYCMCGCAFGKNKIKEYSLSFLCTIGLLFGGIGLVYCNGLNWYPFWTFGAFYSLFFHYIMLFTGVFLLSSNYKKLEWTDALKSFIPIVILSLIATPVNYEYRVDYMQIYDASGVPYINELAIFLANHNIRFLFTIGMLLFYIVLSLFVIGITKIINKSLKKIKNLRKSVKIT